MKGGPKLNLSSMMNLTWWQRRARLGIYQRSTHKFFATRVFRSVVSDLGFPATSQCVGCGENSLKRTVP